MAKVGDTVVGWIHVFYSLRLESHSFCEIGGLVVHEDYRGRGIGSMLVGSVKDWCISLDCPTLKVRSNILRVPAHQFYKNLGFQEKKQQKIFELPL